jgi:hypothetical protein
MRKKVNNRSLLYLFFLMKLIIIIGAYFRTSYCFELSKVFADQELPLTTRINFALDLALKKYDGQKIWLIYSIESSCTIKEIGTAQMLNTDNISLEQIIFRNACNVRNNLPTHEISTHVTHRPEQLNEPPSRKRLEPQLNNNKRSATYKLAIILDYSLESGNPCLYQIYRQRMDQPFSRENRPIFWLGMGNPSISIGWLQYQFYHTKYLKLKQQIIASIGAHYYSRQTIEFMKKIVWGNYSLTFKSEAIYWLSQHNSIESIKLLAILAVKQTDIHLKKKAIFALSQINNSKAKAIVSVLAKKEKNTGIRQEAIFWLSQRADEEAIEVLNEILTTEDDPIIKDYTIFAISQLPENKAVPIFYRILQNTSDAKVRKKARYWLDRTRDQRMMNFFMDLVEEDDQCGLN